MAIENVTEYCAAAQEAAGVCNSMVGVGIGTDILFTIVEDNMFEILAVVVISVAIGLLFYGLSKNR